VAKTIDPLAREMAKRVGAGVHPPGRARRRRLARMLVTVAAVSGGTLAALPAAAVVVAGGGSVKTDCLAVFDAPVDGAAGTARSVRCADGDACDADGLVNGRCEFPIAICGNSTANPRCVLRGLTAVTVAHALDNGDPEFDPEMQAMATRAGFVFEYPETRLDRCSAPTAVHVPVRGPLARGRCRKGTKTIRVLAVSTPVGGRSRADSDALKLTCDPAPAGCDARAFFTSTFDRIQTQIFDQSCAVGGCHDSQTVQAELLLERGAAYDNLVDKVPTNADAHALGWLRVTKLGEASGDAATSYLVRKLAGDLGAGLGKRMPFNRPKLDDGLVEVVRRWVEAGAPADGWVPGTD
jgi:hypothetical protein